MVEKGHCSTTTEKRIVRILIHTVRVMKAIGLIKVHRMVPTLESSKQESTHQSQKRINVNFHYEKDNALLPDVKMTWYGHTDTLDVHMISLMHRCLKGRPMWTRKGKIYYEP